MLEGHNLTNLNVAIPDPFQLLGVKKDAIVRFIGVLVPIMGIYQLLPTSIYIFYDLSGSTITFNREGSIFLNMRYYEAWRMYYSLCLCCLHSSKFKQMMTK